MVLVFLTLLVAVGCASCADYQLRSYRNDMLLDNYHYALGENYLRVGDLKFCFQEMGQGETVLIVPGLGTSIDFWQLNLPALAVENHVVAVDFPGFGKSDKPDVDYTLSWIADEIVAFMDAKQIKRTAVIGGSMGGHLALILALKHPDRVSKLVLMGSVGDWEPPGFLLDAALKSLWQDRLVTTYIRENWPELFSKMIKKRTPMTEGIFRYQMALRANGARYRSEGTAAARALKSIFYSTCRDRLGEITCPVLLIWGGDDHIHPTDGGIYMREHLPDSRLVVVPDSAHEVMIDQSETFNRLVLAFLKSGTAAIADQRPIAKTGE
jgi:pimeloyl-ACP methyl ester carboxylesterase